MKPHRRDARKPKGARRRGAESRREEHRQRQKRIKEAARPEQRMAMRSDIVVQ